VLPKPAFPRRWNAADPMLIAETVPSRIWKVSLDDGRPAIVRDLKARGFEDAASSMAFLAWRRGEGAIKLLGREAIARCWNMPASGILSTTSTNMVTALRRKSRPRC
jgi:streptomycin 6-kinase